MPEAQYTISGFNIAGLDPIEVSRTVTGATVTLTDTDIGRMNVFTGSANSPVTLPSAAGALDGYSKAGRMIGLRGASTLTARVTVGPASGESIEGVSRNTAITTRALIARHNIVLVSDGAQWIVHSEWWPKLEGYFSAYRAVDQSVLAGARDLVFDTVHEGNYSGWYNTATGVFSPTLPGFYRFTLSSYLMPTVAATYGLVYINKNATNYKSVGRMNSIAVNVPVTMVGSATFYLSASDSARGQINVGNTTTWGGGAAEGYFQAEYVGP